MVRYISIIIFFFFTLGMYAQSTWESLSNEGNEYYQKKDYSNAINKYEEALKNISKTEHSSELHYNLANSYYNNKALAKAILHYEKARLISPNDADINFNLDIAKEEIKGDVIPIRDFFFLKYWKKIKMSFTAFTWGIVGISFLWMGIIGILMWMFSKERKQKKIGFIAGISFLVLCIVPFIFSAGKQSIEKDSKRAILMEKEIPFRNAPDGTGDFIIYEGTEMEILDRIGEWTKVRLLNSDVGWVKLDEIEKI